MFSFAYLDKEGQLYLVRDRYGVKPLYYANIKNNFFFSSEIKPLLSLQEFVSLDEIIVDTFFTDTATDFNERSGYNGVQAVKRGHYITINKENKIDEKKWYFSFDNIKILNDKDCSAEIFEEILLDAIKIRCRADVPIAITLSGGIDSTLIYTLIKERTKFNIQPFVFRHENKLTDESLLASNLANKYGDKTIIVKQTQSPLSDLISSLDHLEFPIWSPSVVSYYSMYREIAKLGYKVVIEGHGADEQFGGYPFMVSEAVRESIQNKSFVDAYTYFKVLLETFHDGLGQTPSNLQKIRLIIGFVYRAIRGGISFQKTLNKSFDYKILPIVLRTFDRISMAHSIESRMPFMDYRLVEFARGMPMHKKVSPIGNKAILREILKKYGHHEIYTNKKKMGFASEITEMFKDEKILRFFQEMVEEFPFSKYDNIKEKAFVELKNKISYINIEDVWKIASVAYFYKSKHLQQLK
jgi:asparagine synthase (glutamine-hydrolysing)